MYESLLGILVLNKIVILVRPKAIKESSSPFHLFWRRQIKGGDGRERKAVVGSVESAVDVPPKHPPTVTMIELREPLLTDH